MMTLLRLAVAGSALLCVAGAARADDISAAKMHYERGTNLFDLQRYVDAAKEYEAAFEAKPDPALLFNIAQAYRLGAEYSKAIAAYRSYLRRVPDADNREEIEHRIAELQALNDAQKNHQPTPLAGASNAGEAHRPAPAPAPAPTSEPRTASTPARQAPASAGEKPGRAQLIAGITIGAVGVVALAIGGTFEGLAAATNSSLSHPAPGTIFDPSKERTLKNDQNAGAALLAIGGAALVTGVVVAILSVRHPRLTSAFAPSVGARPIGAVFNATF